MSVQSSNNKQIAKNTLLLYFRMLFMMVVSLYTSRVILNTLGVEDYGIYNVVGGIVVILSFLNGAMASATQRFMNVELGRKDTERLKSVFSTSIYIHFFIAIAILLLAESIGLWFLNNCMNISAGRMTAANWVYQFSIASFLTNVVSVPYNAAIIAHEKMSAFAYISILEVTLKLIMVFLLTIIPYDKLIVFASMIFVISLLVRMAYGIYCKKNFVECKVSRCAIDKPLMKQMLSFSSWTIFGNLGYIFHTQGIAIVINLFFGATVNAAQGISNQVNSVVKNFVTNFLTALNPQVVKSYAAGELETMHRLIIQGAKVALLMVALLVVPIIIEASTILHVWLKLVPDYAVIFVRLVLLLTFFDAYSGLLATAKGATGNIRTYQIILTVIGFFHLPLTWLCFELGWEPYWAQIVYLIIIIAIQITRTMLVCRAIKLSQKLFYREVVARCYLSVGIAAILPFLLHIYLTPGLITTLLVCGTSIIISTLTALFIGFTSKERKAIFAIVLQRVRK